MAVTAARRPGCVLQRTLFSQSDHSSYSESARTCGEPLFLISVDRYVKDLGFGIFFPQAIHSSDYLYDATLTDGDCKVRVTIHPSLSPLIESNKLRCGCQIRNVTFSPAWDENSERNDRATYRVIHLVVDAEAGDDAGLEALCAIDLDTLPWCGVEGEEPSELPLRARRSSYLPLWNNQDYRGNMWRDRPPEFNTNTDSDSGDETEPVRPTITIQKVRQSFRGRSRVIKGVLVVRILRKSALVYYGKAERNCECPYKSVLEVADRSGRASVVLWNTLCMDWYRCLHPGQLLKLSHFRVKESYLSRMGQEEDIEIGLNSRNPCAHISVVPESDVLPQWHLPRTPYSFYCGKDLFTCSLGTTCDVIGLVVFVGRPERIKNKDCQGAELLEYRWIQLEDGTTDQPIMIQLFSTSQPDIHCKIHPLSIMVCTNVQLVGTSPDAPSFFQYLTNTTYTQVYSTGSGHHSTMPYRRLRPVRRFIQWLQVVDEGRLLGRAVVGGFFTFPPLPVSLEQYMKTRKGEPGLLSGAELSREVARMQYRQCGSFAVQATVTAVLYRDVGAFSQWQGHAEAQHRSAPILPGCPPTHAKCFSPKSSVKLSPRSPKLSWRYDPVHNSVSAKRRLFDGAEPPRKRLALPFHETHAAHTEDDRDYSLWDASMEFLEKDHSDDDDDDGSNEDAGGASSTDSFLSAPARPLPSHGPRLGVAVAPRETVPRLFCPQRREVQLAATGLQSNRLQDVLPSRKLDTFELAPSYTGHFTLTLRVLTDGVTVNALFLPTSPGNAHWWPHPHPHSNSWEDILSHGGFAPSLPAPHPSDLVAMGMQLTNQRLLCVLEMCQLGGGRLEVVLVRAFPLKD